MFVPQGTNISYTKEREGTDISHTQEGWGTKKNHPQGGGQTLFLGDSGAYDDFDEEMVV